MVKQLYESLQRAILWLRTRGGTRWCLQTILQLWRRFAQMISKLYSSNQQSCGIPEKPRSILLATDVVSASRLPALYPLEERIPSTGGSLGSASSTPLSSSTPVSSTQAPLQLSIQELPRRQSTSATLSGTTIVSSPIGDSPRGSLPLPYHCKDSSDPDVPKFEATSPSRSRRYNTRSSPSLKVCTIPIGPLTLSLARERELPPEWREYIHPEGQRYFVRAWNVPRINVIVEADVYDPEPRKTLTDFAERVLTRAVADPWLSNFSDLELFVDVDEQGSCSYYFIDHENTVIFWLDEISTTDLYLDFHQVSGLRNLRIRIQEDYWLHQEYFPSHRKVPENDERELVATLTHSCIEVITSNCSTSSLDRSQLESILSVMNNLKNTVGNHGQRNCIIARLWNEIYHTRFINYHGDHAGRLYKMHIAGDEDSPSIFMKIFFLLLFDAPSTHFMALRKVYDDEILYADAWRKYLESLCTNWHDMILWATVLLTANMSFLAIFNSTDQVIQENRAVTCSLVSTLSSTVSIVMGLLHVRKHRPLTTLPATEGVRYLEDAKSLKLGFRPLAILYSLPYAFLMWAMITYIAAILLFVFKSGVNVVSQGFISAIAVALGATLAWVIGYFWKDELGLKDNFRKFRDALRSFSPRNTPPLTHNPEAANNSIVQRWLHKSAGAGKINDPQVEGV